MNKYYSLVTDIGTAAIANAALIGEKVDVIEFAVGDGGGNYYQQVANMTALKGQTRKGVVASVEPVLEQPNIIRITAVIPSNIGGFTIREMGAISRSGQLIAIASTPDMQKVVLADGVPSELTAVIEIVVSNANAVTVTVDPTVIIATKKELAQHGASLSAHPELFAGKAT